MTRYGTAYFPSMIAACRYYAAYSGPGIKAYVERLIKEGAIHIGQPEIKANQRLILIDNDCRYAIEEMDNFVIRHKTNGLLWSDVYGWTDTNFHMYSFEDTQRLNLPTDGNGELAHLATISLDGSTTMLVGKKE